jgi:hypothetical protein
MSKELKLKPIKPDLELKALLSRIKFQREATPKEIEEWADKLSRKVCNLTD